MTAMNELNYEGSTLINETIEVPNNTIVSIETGASIVAAPEMIGPMISVHQANNVIIRGGGALMGNMTEQRTNEIKTALTNGDPVPEEHWHGISIRDSTNVTVEGLGVTSVAGDGVYVGPLDAAGTGCHGVRIDSVVTNACLRNGCSIVHGTEVLVKNFKTLGRGISYGNKGILVEPSDLGDSVSGIELIACDAEGPRSHGIHVQMSRGGDIKLLMYDCVYSGDGYATRSTCPRERRDMVTGMVRYVNCPGRHWDEWAARAQLVRI
jgi:hypothetical protein